MWPRSRRSTSTSRCSRLSRMSSVNPSCRPDSPVRSERARVTSSTGARGWSVSNRLLRMREALCQFPAACLKRNVRSQVASRWSRHSTAAPPAYLPRISGRAYAFLSRESTATKRTSMEAEVNGSAACSATASSCFMGTRGLSSTPRESLHALRPAGPNWSTIAPSGMAATSPMARRPKRLRLSLTSGATGSRSIDWGARKARTSAGAWRAPSASAVRAATRAGNLASATPIRGAR